MSSDNVEKRNRGSVLAIPGVTVLTFPDGSLSVIPGLIAILAAVYNERREVTEDTAEEILKRVAARNHIDRSVRQWYCELLLKEYRKYCDDQRVDDNVAGSDRGVLAPQGVGVAMRLSKIFFKVFPPTHPWPLVG